MKDKPGISRRTVLRGLGVAVGLPWLEAMAPARSLAASADASKPPLRAAFLFVPNGMNMQRWKPDEAGPLGDLPPTLQPLARHRRELLLCSGLTLNGGRSLGDGGGDHARCLASFLTGAHPNKTAGKDIRNGISIDQRIAAEIGDQTRLPSLELGIQPNRQGGACDTGYSCVYSSVMSWRSPTSPILKEINPRAAFDRLFGSDVSDEKKHLLARRNRDQSSILDFALDDAKSLHGKLGANDCRKLDEYLYAVRQIERRIAESEKSPSSKARPVDYPRPSGIPREYGDHVRLMLDIMVLAMQSDATRVLSFMFANAGNNRSYPEVGVRQGHHSLSHHGNNRDKLESIAKIDQYNTGLLNYFLDKLADTKENGSRLLDNVVVLYGSGLADGNRHQHEDLPILVAGRGGGALNGGRHLAFPKETPLTNLYLSIARIMGVAADRFSDSTGPLEGLG